MPKLDGPIAVRQCGNVVDTSKNKEEGAPPVPQIHGLKCSSSLPIIPMTSIDCCALVKENEQRLDQLLPIKVEEIDTPSDKVIPPFKANASFKKMMEYLIKIQSYHWHTV